MADLSTHVIPGPWMSCLFGFCPFPRTISKIREEDIQGPGAHIHMYIHILYIYIYIYICICMCVHLHMCTNSFLDFWDRGHSLVHLGQDQPQILDTACLQKEEDNNPTFQSSLSKGAWAPQQGRIGRYLFLGPNGPQ